MAEGNVSEINREIYNLRCKIASDFLNKESDPDDYPDLDKLTNFYDKLIEQFSYKFFLYGVLLNLYTEENSKDLFRNNKDSIVQKIKLISDFADKEEMQIKHKISQNILLSTYKKEWLKIYNDNNK